MTNSEKQNRKVGYLLERTTRAIKLNFLKVFKEIGADITPEQWVIMDLLSEHNQLLQVDLAEKSYKDKPTISRIIDVLVRKSLVSRKADDNDRRKTIISLTPDGKSLVRKCQRKVNKLRDKTWSGLSDEDYGELIKITDRIFQNLG